MTFAQYQALIGAGGEVASLQKQYLLPVIMEEKEAFIRAEYGRLQSVMGSEYHEGETTHVFHPLPEAAQGEERMLGNPQELELAELAMLPHLNRRIPRLGTVSVMPLFQAYPADSFRLQLLADAHERVMIGMPLTDAQTKTLLNGHAEYMLSKQPQEVVVIK